MTSAAVRPAIAATKRRVATKPPSDAATIFVADRGAMVPLAAKAPPGATESAEAEFGRQLQTLLKTSLKPGITALLVVDATTGLPIFALRPDTAMNPASNVKMIATATTLAILGADHRFATQLLGPIARADPHRINGDIYLLGSYDPTFDTAGLRTLAANLHAQGVTHIDGNIVFGQADRDGPYGARLPVEVVATTRGKAPAVTVWPGEQQTVVINRAKTVRKGRTRIAIVQRLLPSKNYQLTITGTIAVGNRIGKTVAVQKRPRFAGQWLRWELTQLGIAVAGDITIEPLHDYLQRLASDGQFAVALATRTSATVGELVTRINKRSINWLADRLVAVAAGFEHNVTPTMARGIAQMRAWLLTRAAIDPATLTIDTGSGLSYRTRISPTQLVAVIRNAAGFTFDAPAYAATWTQSLSIGGKDGTLAHRFRAPQFADRIHAKTGTLSNVIALSGLLLTNPARPLAFALVTNKHARGYKTRIRRAHEQVIAALTAYVAKHDGVALLPAAPSHDNAASARESGDVSTDDESDDDGDAPAP
ncbi:MAG: D-alanyl-D-alanine carboxypeptidase [Kofleriaceae bacterium]|nr:D-alanyl-D-alanine carboxypeptidase [Kofleriaceae bacterium]